MSRRRLTCAIPLLLLAGCSNRGPTTLGDLPSPPPRPVAASTLDAKRDDAIRGYEAYLATAQDPRLRAEALRRLADLRLEDSEAHAADDAAASADAVAAIELYRQRLRDFPAAADNDHVRYQLARAYENLGRREEALAVLDRLVDAHPNSELIAEAQFRRGEMLFVAQDYLAAEQAYRAVIEHGSDGAFYATALYKRGWSVFKQADYPRAVDDFMAVLDLDEAGDDTAPRPETDAGADALRATGLAFSYLDGPDSLADYYRSRGHDRHQDRIYQALGELYLEKERHSDAAKTFEAFVAAAQTHTRAPLFQLRAIEIYQQAGYSDEVLEGKRRFVRLYRLNAPYWANRQPTEHPEVVEPLEATLRDLAHHYHAVAQKSRKAADYDTAEDWYRQYLADFNDRPGAQEMRFLFAELLFERGDYAHAAEQYEHAAYDYGFGGRAAEAGYAALLAYDAHGKKLQGEQATNWEALSLMSAQRFATSFPDHAQAAPALTRAAERLFARGDGAAAQRAAESLLSVVPATTPAQRLTAWTIVGHTSFDQADYLKAEKAYQESLASPALKSEQRPALRERLAATIYQQAEQARIRGEMDLAVEEFLRVGKAVPESTIRATAEYDAAALLMQLKKWPQAIAVLQAFRQSYPKHQLQPDVTQKLAVAYLEDGRQADAAREFNRIADESPDPAVRREALLRSAELFAAAAAPASAAAALEQYLTQFPTPVAPAMEARQQLIAHYQALGDTGSVRRTRQAIIDADRAAGAERSDRTRYLAAHASLALAQEALVDYRAIRLVEPIAKTLPQKKSAMKAALDAYGNAAEYGVADVATAATFAIADVYADFGRALLQSDRPKNLDDEALEQYELMLEEEAYPFEEKAISLHELNAGRAAKGVYDKWVRKSYGALAKLMPARYAKTERKGDVADKLR